MKLIGGIDFDELRRLRVKNYDTFTVDLTVAQTDKDFPITGNYLYIVEATDIDANLSVRINEQSRKQIRLVHGRAVRTPFYRLYLSWPAQAAKTATIAFGIGQQDAFEIIDTGKALELTGEVTVTDSKRAEVFNAEHGAGYQSRLGGVDQRGVVGLWNPVGSGINAYVYSIVAWMSIINLAFIDSIGGWAKDSAGRFLSGNKKAGGVDTACYLVDEVLTITSFNENYRSGSCLALDRLDPTAVPAGRRYRAPYCIPPGFGLVGLTEEDTETACVAFEWYEKAI
ncbi:hypothetical protein ES705_11643 [subsurface metagenome]